MWIGIFSFGAFDRRLARLAAPISSGVRQGGGGRICPPPPAGRVRLNTPAGRGLMVITSEREARSEFFCGLTEKSEYARPKPTWPDPTQPNPTQHNLTPVTLLRSLYLWNELTDSRAVFFVRCHHSIHFVFDRHRYPPVLATARGTCRVRCLRHPTLGNMTAGPIVFKFGARL